MASERIERKLAAIAAADVAGGLFAADGGRRGRHTRAAKGASQGARAPQIASRHTRFYAGPALGQATRVNPRPEAPTLRFDASV